jgi:hypothetical protein
VAPDVEFVIAQLPLLDGPTPKPSGLVVAGDTDVNVTATLPAVATENVKTSEPLGPTEPLNVSVVDVPAEGVVGLPNRLLSGFVQADAMIAQAEASSDRSRRRTVIRALSAWAPALIRRSDISWRVAGCCGGVHGSSARSASSAGTYPLEAGTRLLAQRLLC